MSVILNLETKNETLNDIISNNPFYIDIKGSVNICLVKCGQNIEDCQSVNFSTMTNYGKILVLNKSGNSTSKCDIKLAFDSNNDTINNDGDAKYKFETAFVTVPSLHKLNNVIYDMETFLVFSSVQKNGNILYVCLCTFNMGVNSLPQGDWKLLNYKLMDELFVQKNIVPDIYGTNEIAGVPNPIDINNFIPKKGFRNFYDYTHPKNTKVNFRVFQTPLSVSNIVIDTLKSKLTPGNTYINFKNAISQTINPVEGLFFYFSEDLTDRYKSFEANNKVPEIKDKDNNKDKILEEDNEDNVLNKLDVIDDEELLKQILEEDNSFDDNKETEKFEANNNSENKAFSTYAIFLLISIFCIISIYTYMIKNIFKSNNGISEDDIVNYTNDIFDPNMSKVISTKFKINVFVSIQFILTFIIVFLLIASIPLNNNNVNIDPIYTAVFIFVLILIIIVGLLFYHYIKYLFYRIKGLYDDDFSQKENYLYNFIKDKIYNSNFISNISNILNENFTNFLIEPSFQNINYNLVQSGGDPKFDHVPGDNFNNNVSKIDKNIFGIGDFSINNFFELINNAKFTTKMKDNKEYNDSLTRLYYPIIIFYVFCSFLQLIFSNIGNNESLSSVESFKNSNEKTFNGVKFIISFLTSSVLYIPICIILMNDAYKSTNTFYKYTIYICSIIIFLVSAFTISINPIDNNPINNIGFWIVFSVIIIAFGLKLLFYLGIIKNFLSSTKIGESKTSEDQAVLKDRITDLEKKIATYQNFIKQNEGKIATNTTGKISIIESNKTNLYNEINKLKDQSSLNSDTINNLRTQLASQSQENPQSSNILKQKLNELSETKSKLALLENHISDIKNNNSHLYGQKESGINNKSQEEIERLQDALLQMTNNFNSTLNSKQKMYNDLISQFDNSRKEIDNLKAIIPKQKNLAKTLDYLELISNIFYKLQELRLATYNKSKKEAILEILTKLQNIDDDTNVTSEFKKELNKLQQENIGDYAFIYNKLHNVVNKIKEISKSILNNFNSISKN